MSKNTGWSTEKGSSYYNKFRYEIIKLINDGVVLAEIAKKFGGKRSNLYRWIKTNNITVPENIVKCAIIECNNYFIKVGKKKCCSNLHIRRLNARHNIIGVPRVCKLPECSNLLINMRKLFCCDEHADTDSYRKLSGFYERLLNKNPKCLACDEWRVVDIHHLEFNGKKSNKESETVALCPTHHHVLHAGLAEICDGNYIYLENQIIHGLTTKSPEFTAYSKEYVPFLDYTPIFNTKGYVKCASGLCNKYFQFDERGKIVCSRACGRYITNRLYAEGPHECKLPECRSVTDNQYCSKSHSIKHSQRYLEGIYRRIMLMESACIVCGEYLFIHEHHLKFSGKQSDKTSQTVVICPTHHMAIHRNMAKFEDEKFIWTVDKIIDGQQKFGANWEQAH